MDGINRMRPPGSKLPVCEAKDRKDSVWGPKDILRDYGRRGRCAFSLNKQLTSQIFPFSLGWVLFVLIISCGIYPSVNALMKLVFSQRCRLLITVLLRFYYTWKLPFKTNSKLFVVTTVSESVFCCSVKINSVLCSWGEYMHKNWNKW